MLLKYFSYPVNFKVKQYVYRIMVNAKDLTGGY
jgi:hypothetical protein